MRLDDDDPQIDDGSDELEDSASSGSIPPPEVDYGPRDPIPGLFAARETHLLSGASGGGKTTFIGWFVAQLMTRDLIWGYPILHPRFVGYIAADRAARSARRKFTEAGWRYPAVYGLVDHQDPTIRTQLRKTMTGGGKDPGVSGFTLFTKALEYFRQTYFHERSPRDPLPPDSLIIVDGMAAIFGIEPSGSYLRQVAAPLLLLNMLCRDQKLTVLLVHHAGKQVADKAQRYARPQDRVLGSTALLGFTSTQLVVEEPQLSGRKDGLYTLTVCSHDAPGFSVLFDRASNGAFVEVGNGAAIPDASLDALQDSPGGRGEDPKHPWLLEFAKRGVLELLRTYPEASSALGVPANEFNLACQRRYGLSQKSVYRQFRALADAGYVQYVYGKGSKKQRIRLCATPAAN
jgi:hypothetical protein